MRPGLIINARQKEKFVGRAVHSALDQTVPCEIIISDQNSRDHTLREIWKAVEEHGKTHHNVRVLRCPVDGPYGMRACNQHFHWAWQQLPKDVDVIFQLSADDYSLPDRVKVCMEGIGNQRFDVLACTMYFEEPGKDERKAISGYPRQTGYVNAAEGLTNLAYGSVIAAYHRPFLERMDDGGSNTLDVYYGFLASLANGFYVVANPQHVHVQHSSTENMGFQGKLRGATGNEIMQLAELNHFQLAQLYMDSYEKAQALHPEGIDQNAINSILSMILGQTKGWIERRKDLHVHNIVPGVLPA
jgi:hypothetical protein